MLQVNFDPFPILTTERLVLREIKNTDAKDFFVMRSNADTMRYIPRPVAVTEADVLEVIDRISTGLKTNESISWGITLKGENKFVGSIGFVRMKKENYRAEIGYILHPDLHGKGIMYEALQACIDYGFKTMKLHTIEGIVDARNIASAKLLEKSGFIKEGYFKEDTFHNGEFSDSVYYTLFKTKQ